MYSVFVHVELFMWIVAVFEEQLHMEFWDREIGVCSRFASNIFAWHLIGRICSDVWHESSPSYERVNTPSNYRHVKS